MLVNNSTVEKTKEHVIEASWSYEEFKMISFGDKRIDRRFIKVAKELSAKPLAPINQACETWADTKAAYRLFDNEEVMGEEILAVHQERTVERMKGQEIVLAVQDTTCLNYTHHREKKGMGPIGTSKQDLRGVLMHNTLAMTVKGLPLGLLTQEIWARDEGDKGCSNRRKEIPIEEKESYKWLKALDKTEDLRPASTRVVTICDREADIYEFFDKAKERKAEVVVRAAQDRKLTGEMGKLWDYMGSQPVAGHLKIEVPEKEKEPAREATVEVRFATVILNPPNRPKSLERKSLEPIPIDAVWVKEVNAPANVTPLEWMLLTNVAVKTFEDAIERITWYKRRWNIEVYHKVFKSGCTVEDCRLQTAERLIPYLTLNSIIAWRLFWMTKINSQQPSAPCTVVLADHEWKPLYCKIHHTTKLPDELPTVRNVVRWIGQLGGFLGRKRDKEPGITAIWRGWQRLTDISALWLIFQQLE